MFRFLKSEKRKYFEYRLKVIIRKRWDFEFQKEKMKLVREDMRQQYDRLNEQNQMAIRRLEEEKAKEAGQSDEKVKENLTRLVEKYTPDLEYLKKQMDAIDNEVDGENNAQSITQQIEGLRTVEGMLKSYYRRV